MRALHTGAEWYPLVKTGGLGDVMAALPEALLRDGADVRLLLPGYPALLDAAAGLSTVAALGPRYGAARVDLLLGRLPGSEVPTYLIDAPYLYRRTGNPYLGPDGRDWPDNLQRFGLLGWVAAQLAAGGLDPAWQPDVVHAHDWHAALACTWLSLHPASAAATVYTVHNLAFHGLFPLAEHARLGLPAAVATLHGLEFHGSMSFMKGGLFHADRVTTVSPSYAREMGTPELGCGLDGLVRSRGAEVVGILNGIDEQVWDPRRDPLIPARYDAVRFADGKAACKRALQASFGLADRPDAPLLGVVSRLTQQKGLDLLLDALPTLLAGGGQIALQGTGDGWMEQGWRQAAAMHPGQVGVHIGYDEPRAHAIVAGADAIAVPSRFEPCGLTQMYGLRYGTLPLVRRVGGLADTVVDADEGARAANRATGIVFEDATVESLQSALRRLIALYQDREGWTRVRLRAMSIDHGWAHAAQAYEEVYRQARHARLGRRMGTSAR